MKNEIKPLPKLADLYADVDIASKNNELNRILNCEPKTEWIKVNPFANGSKYIPVGTIEYLLTSIYIKWRVEVKTIQIIANSVVVSVRLFVLDPITGEWDWQDGIGASPIQTAKGAAATDFTQVNTAAVQMAAPAAESYAFKDAAEKFGKLFGKDLNRKDELNYGSLNSKFDTPLVVQDNPATATNLPSRETIDIIVHNIYNKVTVHDLDVYMYAIEPMYKKIKEVAAAYKNRKESIIHSDIPLQDEKLDIQNKTVNDWVEREREIERD